MNTVSVRRAFVAGACLLLWAITTGAAFAADKGIEQTYPQPIAAVQKAAATALTVVGCEIKKDVPGELEGYRGRKIGVFVGSGGETIFVTLTAEGDAQTRVAVRTKKTFVGGAGQKNWNQPVLDEIAKALAAPATEAPAAAPAEAPASPPSEPAPAAAAAPPSA